MDGWMDGRKWGKVRMGMDAERKGEKDSEIEKRFYFLFFIFFRLCAGSGREGRGPVHTVPIQYGVQ